MANVTKKITLVGVGIGAPLVGVGIASLVGVGVAPLPRRPPKLSSPQSLAPEDSVPAQDPSPPDSAFSALLEIQEFIGLASSQTQMKPVLFGDSSQQLGLSLQKSGSSNPSIALHKINFNCFWFSQLIVANSCCLNF